MSKENTPKTAPGDQAKKAESKAPFVLYDYIELFVFTVVVVVLLLTLFLRLCVVSGRSMNTTLLHGERLLVSDFAYTPKQGDIIVFHQTSDTSDQFNEPIVKRVIATEGQFVKINYLTNKVYVSDDSEFTEDEMLTEDYIIKGKPDYLPSDQDIFEYEVPEGHLFVKGDNRPESADSQYPEVDFVDERRVLGKVLLRVSPLSKFGKVE